MRIHSVIPRSQANGPGVRYTIWFQGCSIRCEGCTNKHMWSLYGGTEVSPRDLLNQYLEESAGTDGISLTGGEPLDQYEGLIEFLRLCREYEIEVFMTSGYTLDRIKGSWPEVLDLVDILIDGPFEQDKLDDTAAWRGSTNQGINLLSPRAQQYKDYVPDTLAEIICNPDGTVTMTGFGAPNLFEEDSDA